MRRRDEERLETFLGCSVDDLSGKTYVRAYHERTFDQLYRMGNIHTEGERLRAAVARDIVQWLKANGLDAARIEGAEFLLIFSLYWWASFCRGYMFELIVFRDLEAFGIQFIPHDPRLREERYVECKAAGTTIASEAIPGFVLDLKAVQALFRRGR